MMSLRLDLTDDTVNQYKSHNTCTEFINLGGGSGEGRGGMILPFFFLVKIFSVAA